MKKTDIERLKKIVSVWEALSSEITQRSITRELLLTEQFSQWAVTTPIYNIGEQVYQLSPEFKKEYPDIPWSVVSGLRHRLVHDYDGINWSLIADVIFDDMEPFVMQVKYILRNKAAERLIAELDKGLKSAEKGWLTPQEVETQLGLRDE